MNEHLGIDRHHPDFIRARRQRFVKLLREAKRVLGFSEDERKALIALCKMIERNTTEAK